MNKNFNLTINELPKTKKMQVDEQHPMLKLQQNVHILMIDFFRNLHKINKKK